MFKAIPAPAFPAECTWHYGRPAILMAKEVMAASDANDLKTSLRQRGNQLRAREPVILGLRLMLRW